MATRDIVPRADSEGGIGTTLKRWAAGWFDAINGKDISSGVATTAELGALTYTSVGAAPASQGVTNGNSHDHNGGDGGQIAHTALSGIGTNTHAQIDTHISNTANPHGVTAAQAGAIPTTTGAATAYVSAATESAAGIVELATTAEAQTGTDTSRAVTPAGLAAGAKGLISTNTTIYVATTGSDTTGTGASGAPFASISKALSSIAGKLIASGVTVTISVADGTYYISSTITIDHPDADKIQILGNTSAETLVTISSIDTTAKTITVSGDYTDHITAGDIIVISDSSTSGLNGAYVVSDRTYSGGNTVITCAAETFASATVGGGRVVIKPCNRCILSCSSVSYMLGILSSLSLAHGFRFNGNTSVYCIWAKYKTGITLKNCVFYGGGSGFAATDRAYVTLDGCVFKSQTSAGIYSNAGSYISIFKWGSRFTVFDSCLTGCVANGASNILLGIGYYVHRGCTNDTSPVVGSVGNSGSLIFQGA